MTCCAPVSPAVGVLPGVAVRTNKPVTVNRAQDGLQTGDRNTDRKFAFISAAARPDYRPQQVSRAQARSRPTPEWPRWSARWSHVGTTL